jgi:antitoxin ChpS
LHFCEIDFHEAIIGDEAKADCRHSLKSSILCYYALNLLWRIAMLSMPLRKQGGAAVLTIPPSVLKGLNAQIGTQLSLELQGDKLVIQPMRSMRKRYSLSQLLEGSSPRLLKALNQETAWSREGEAVGREIA